jgi:HAD superfamily hydrolase (TIGR01509 family)
VIQAIIFDMDGVLIDAKEWHYEALNRALSLFGYEISRYDHLITYDGLPTSDKLKMLALEYGLPEKLHGFINELKQQYTMEFVHTRLRPIFTHEYALSRLKQDGYRLAVASNSIRDTVEVMMRQSGLSGYLEFLLSNQDVSKAKPDPEIYSAAIARLGLSPTECLVVEDNRNGVQAARSAGAHVMEVSDVYDVSYENITAHIKEINTKEANTKEANTKDANTKEANAKEANTKEANAEAANTKEANTKEANERKANAEAANA